MTRHPTCPHADVRFCPLYVASHIAGAGGCDDGHLGMAEGRCAVDRGMDYAAARRRLEIEQFEMVATCEWREKQEAAEGQRARNRQAVGLA